MKKGKKGKLKENLIEALLEFALTMIFFVIGWGILSLFDIDTEKIDSDLTVLIGIAVIAVIFGAVALTVHFVKKKKTSQNKEKEE